MKVPSDSEEASGLDPEACSNPCSEEEIVFETNEEAGSTGSGSDCNVIPSGEEDEIITTLKEKPSSPTIGESPSLSPEPLAMRQRKQSQSHGRRSSIISDKVMRFDDHFTLQRPSSSVTFQRESVHIYELRDSQVQMKVSVQPDHNTIAENKEGMVWVHPPNNNDKDGNNDDGHKCDEAGDDFPYNFPPVKIEIKNVYHDRSEHISALRLTYTIVALFCMATFFCFGFLVILFLFMDMVSDAGLAGESNTNLEAVLMLGQFLGTMFAIPVFLYGFSSLLTVWGFFISETWQGFPFLRTVVTDLDEVVIEWVSVSMMLGVPFVALLISLFLQVDNWWEITIFVWYVSVSLFFSAFTIVVVYCEIEAAWLIVHKDCNDQLSRWGKTKYFLDQAIRRTQDKKYCGTKEKLRMMSYITDAASSIANGRDSSEDDSKIFMQSHRFWRRYYTKMTQWKYLSLFFKPIDPPERVFSMEDVVSHRWFATRNNWSIEKSLCLSPSYGHVVVVEGPGALKQSQIISTIVCFVLSILGLLLLVLGFYQWLDLPLGTFLVFVLLIGVMFWQRMTGVWRFLHVYRKHKEKAKECDIDCDDVDNPITEDGIYQTLEIYRVSRPTRTLRIIFLLLHKGNLYVFPIVTLIMLENYPVLFLFVIVGIWSCLRYWLDPVNMLNYYGNFERVGRSKNKMMSQAWKDQSRISTILLNVTRARGTKFYMTTFLMIIVVLFTLTIGSVGLQTGILVEDFYWEKIRLTPIGNFVYPPQQNMLYPTCSLMNNANILNSTETTLIDYSFLATMMYQDPKTLQVTLDEWFGPGVGKMDTKTTSDYKNTLKNPNLAVNYDIVSFGDKMSVVAVKGSSSPWEFLTDAQLWAAVGLMQIFISILPAGSLFNPILDDVLHGMGFVESKALKEIQLNSQTTGLVEYLNNTVGSDHSISITGHSLGGGIALITGAETNIPAISISGPNNVFSRKTFDPALDLDTINKMMFNVIPERDIVPRFDKPGLLTQHVACRAKANNFMDCHYPVRTMCELMVTCGSFNRPPPCDCAVRYGYDEPQHVSGDRSYSDICGTKRTNDGFGVPYSDE